jgi:hypothetical protein
VGDFFLFYFYLRRQSLSIHAIEPKWHAWWSTRRASSPQFALSRSFEERKPQWSRNATHARNNYCSAIVQRRTPGDDVENTLFFLSQATRYGSSTVVTVCTDTHTSTYRRSWCSGKVHFLQDSAAGWCPLRAEQLSLARRLRRVVLFCVLSGGNKLPYSLSLHNCRIRPKWSRDCRACGGLFEHWKYEYKTYGRRRKVKGKASRSDDSYS